MIEQLYARHVDGLRRLYDDALAKSEIDAVVVHAGSLQTLFLDDTTAPFRPNPLFKSWVPLTEHPECFVVYRPGEQPVLVYFQPRDYWHQPPADPDGYWTGVFDIQVVAETEGAKAHLPSGRVVLLGEWQDRFGEWGFADRNPSALLDRLHFARAWKSDYEIECMVEASRLGALGHRAALRAFEAGESEFGIHLAYMAACRQSDALLPYTNIIALNAHGSVLHYMHRDTQPPADRLSFLIDAGASSCGYASDITRTYSAQTDRFAELIGAMDVLQQGLCAELRPGTSYVELNQTAHARLGELLHDTGLVSMDGAEAVSSGVTRAFLPHGLGHFIGLQVHDVGGFMTNEDGAHVAAPTEHPFLRLTRTVEAGQVMTVEPGLYFIPMLLEPLRKSADGKRINWKLVDALTPCGGIRIEDDVLVTDDGPRNLTREAFAALAV